MYLSKILLEKLFQSPLKNKQCLFITLPFPAHCLGRPMDAVLDGVLEIHQAYQLGGISWLGVRDRKASQCHIILLRDLPQLAHPEELALWIADLWRRHLAGVLDRTPYPCDVGILDLLDDDRVNRLRCLALGEPLASLDVTEDEISYSIN